MNYTWIFCGTLRQIGRARILPSYPSWHQFTIHDLGNRWICLDEERDATKSDPSHTRTFGTGTKQKTMAKKLILAQRLALVALVVLSVGGAFFAFVSLEVAVMLVCLALAVAGGLLYLSGRNLIQSTRTVVRQEDRVVKERDQQIKAQLAQIAQIVSRHESAPSEAAGIKPGVPSAPVAQRAVGDGQLIVDLYTELRGVQNALAGLRAEQAGIRHDLMAMDESASKNDDARAVRH